MNLIICRFVPGFDEIVSSIYDLILISYRINSLGLVCGVKQVEMLCEASRSDSWFKIIPQKPSSQDAKRNAKQDYQRVGSINRCTAARYCSYVATPAATAAATATGSPLGASRMRGSPLGAL